MRILNQFTLMERVEAKFDEMRSFVKVDAILDAYKVRYVRYIEGMGRKNYTLARLKDIDINLLIQIAQEELDMDISDLLPTSAKPDTPPAKIKHDSSPMVGFISYETTDVDYANVLRDILKHYNINAFVAYKDAEEAEEFPVEIKKALNKTAFFISIHTEQFSISPWCQQEIGFAVAKDIKIIPIKLRDIPQGFIKDTNAIVRDANNIKIVAERILRILAKNPTTKEAYSVKIADKVAQEPIDELVKEYNLKFKKIDVKTYTLTAEDLAKDTSMEIGPVIAIMKKLGLIENKLYHLPALQGRNHRHKFTVSARDKVLEAYPLDMENRIEKIEEFHKEYRKDIEERFGR